MQQHFTAQRQGGQATDDAEAEHERQHLRAARHAVAEIAAIGDDVDRIVFEFEGDQVKLERDWSALTPGWVCGR